jgi:hypothetical protein
MAENCDFPKAKANRSKTGTVHATIANTPSCRLVPPAPALGRNWGGARNRADRVSQYLSRSQIEGMMAAMEAALTVNMPFNRHWIIHYERVGIAPENGAAFVGHVLRLVGAYARRHGGKSAAVWAREDGDGKGAHVHILLHLSEGLTLRHRVRGWIKAAGGRYKRNASKVKLIGGRLRCAYQTGEGALHYHANLKAVQGYLTKAATVADAKALGLSRYGEGGRVVGKRCGWTQNLGVRSR